MINLSLFLPLSPRDQSLTLPPSLSPRSISHSSSLSLPVINLSLFLPLSPRDQSLTLPPSLSLRDQSLALPTSLSPRDQSLTLPPSLSPRDQSLTLPSSIFPSFLYLPVINLSLFLPLSLQTLTAYARHFTMALSPSLSIPLSFPPSLTHYSLSLPTISHFPLSPFRLSRTPSLSPPWFSRSTHYLSLSFHPLFLPPYSFTKFDMLPTLSM